MEPVTHFLTGACLGRAGFNRKTRLATVTMCLAAEAADLDVLAYFGGSSSFGFAHHRGFTHTVWGAPLVAAFTLAVVYGLDRLWRRMRPKYAEKPEPRWGLLYLFACIAAWSHILLDFTNNYGVRPFWPFYNRWFSWDIVFIIEPLLLIMLFGGLVMPWLFGLVNSEIGARKRGPQGRGWAIAALVGMVLLWGVRDFEHRRAIAELDAREYQDQVAKRVAAMPVMVNPFRWNGLVETQGAFLSMSVDTMTPEVDPAGRTVIYYKPQVTETLKTAEGSYTGRVYMDWAQWAYLEEQPLQDPKGTHVVFRDLRFVDPTRSGQSALGAFVDVDASGKVVDEGFLRASRR